jgi:hypothetical protein
VYHRHLERKDALMLRPPIALALLALLALPVTASAKEVKSATVCGASGCHTVTGSAARNVVEGGGPAGPPAAAPFYSVRVKIAIGAGRTDSWRTAWVPSRDRVRGLDEVNHRYAWMTASAGQADALNAAARGLTPFPASRLSGWARPVSTATSPPPAPQQSETSFDWLPAVLIVLAAAAAAAAGGLALRRHRRGPAAT